MKHIYTIMLLDTEHINEICEDIKNQVESGVAEIPLFKMTLVPEGTPPADKAKLFCEKYLLFKNKLDSMGISSGVLVQATMGHGWVLGEKFPFQSLVAIDGSKGAELDNTVCPYDKGFKEYLYDAFRTIASCNPYHIMVDDDFRLLGRAGGGCGCPLHMKRFEELSGKKLTREELHRIMMSESENSKEYTEIFLETQRESLVETAKVMRRGIDSVDETIPGSFCCVGNNAEFSGDIAKILAGKNNPVVVRINNGNYLAAGARYFSNHFFRAASQIAKLKGTADVILAETDTCPQNRYSTGAMSVHTHFTGSILEGASGAKQWITRLKCYEPESGKAYRRVLSKNRGFYDALADIVPTLSWRGCRIRVSSEPKHVPGVSWSMGESYGGWGRCVLERLGLPMYFSAKNGGVLCLDGKTNMTDDEITEALKGTVFLASDTAEQLIARGFGRYLGVDVKPWTGKSLKGEKLYAGGVTNRQMGAKQLVVTDDKAEVLSMVYNTLDDAYFEDLFPGSVMYKNSLGGMVVTFCGTPDAPYNLTDAFSFLTYSRKKQLVEIIKKAGQLPVYYPEDEEVYLKAADMPDGGLFCAVFNLGLDPIDKMSLVFEREITRIEKLMPDGSRKELSFEREGEKYVLDTPCYTLEPVVVMAY